MNTNLLKGHIRAAGMTQANVADAMGVSISRFNAKLNERGDAEFKLTELLALRGILKLSDKEFCAVFLTGGKA